MAAHALSGDVTMTAGGVVTIANDAVTSAKIAADTIENVDIAENAIDFEELRLKIKCGVVLVGVTGSGENTVAHDLSGVPVVVATPSNDNFTVGITSIDATNFTVAYENLATGQTLENIQWVAIYQPSTWG